jgi:hypothetical protein
LLGQYGNVIAGHFTGHTNSKFLDIYKSWACFITHIFT